MILCNRETHTYPFRSQAKRGALPRMQGGALIFARERGVSLLLRIFSRKSRGSLILLFKG